VPVRIANVTDRDQVLSEGTVEEHVEPVAWTMPVGEQELPPPTTQGPCEQFQVVISDAKPNVNATETQALEGLIAEFRDVFATNSDDFRCTDRVCHRIDAGDAWPIRQPPRRLPLAKQAEVDNMLDDMKRKGVIEESVGPWSSPVVLVRKKKGELRFCVDYRKLNDVTKKDCFRLPWIEDTLDTLAGAMWFLTLDLKSGYWQVALRTDDKEKMAFSTGQGLWQFTVMLFGLCNAPATFERLMESVLRGLIYDSCLVYLDDIIVIGRTFQEHLDNLRKVFERLREAHLNMNPEKCRSAVPGTHRILPGSDDGSRKAGGCKMLTTTEGQAPAEELPWTVHVLPKVHFWVRRDRKTLKSVDGRKTASSLVSGS
jgi:hypothetical protein